MSLRMEDRKEDSRMMSLDCATIEKITQLNSTAATHFILKTVFSGKYYWQDEIFYCLQASSVRRSLQKEQ